jgi:hypothetical protein
LRRNLADRDSIVERQHAAARAVSKFAAATGATSCPANGLAPTMTCTIAIG